jgi:hypothetical protein
MEIDCGRCEMRDTGCQDCVVTVLEPRNVGDFPVTAPHSLGAAEVKALGVLAAAGMLPPLRPSLPGTMILPAARAWMQRAFPDTKAS